MNQAGQFVGSVSGGCIEDVLVTRYRDGELAGPTPTMIDFGVDRQEATRSGLPCGGRLEVMVEEFCDITSITNLLARLNNGELVARQVNLANGQSTLLPGHAGADLQVSEIEVIKTFGPAWQLLIIGDGQLARHLASMSLQLDYRVVICDPRDSFSDPTPIESVIYSHEMPDDAVKKVTDQARTAIVALAHDPRQDDLALSEALESQAFYIGALGSNRSAQARLKRLKTLGYTEKQLARIHGPAGLYIGSKRPPEIALSILAQITAIRNNV